MMSLRIMEEEFDRDAFLESHKDKLQDLLEVLQQIVDWVDVYNDLCRQFNATVSDGEARGIMEIYDTNMCEMLCGTSMSRLLWREEDKEQWEAMGVARHFRCGPKYTPDPISDTKQRSESQTNQKAKAHRYRKVNPDMPRLGAEQSWKCAYCQECGDKEAGPDKRTWHVDHMYAQSLGGDSRSDNLVLACATCNLKKGRLRLAEFLEVSR